MTFEASGSVTFEIDNLDQVGSDLAAEAEQSFGSVTIPASGGGGGGGSGLSGRQRRRARRMSRAAQEQTGELGQQTDVLENILAELEEGVGPGDGGGGGGGGGGLFDDVGDIATGGLLARLLGGAGAGGILGGLLSGARLGGGAAAGLPFFGNRTGGPGDDIFPDPDSDNPIRAFEGQLNNRIGDIIGDGLEGLGLIDREAGTSVFDNIGDLDNPEVGGEDMTFSDVADNAQDNIEGGLDFAGSVAEPLFSGGGAITPADEETQETFAGFAGVDTDRMQDDDADDGGGVDLTGTDPADEETQQSFREFLRGDPSQTGDVNLTGGTADASPDTSGGMAASVATNELNRQQGALPGTLPVGVGATAAAGADLPTDETDDGDTITVNADVTVEQSRDESVEAKINRATQQLRSDILSQIERDGSAPSAGIQNRFSRSF